MRRYVLAVLVLASCSKHEEAPSSSTATPSATGAATTTPTASIGSKEKAPERLADDLVPKDEAIAGSILVDVGSSGDKTQDGYRYQVPPGFRSSDASTWTGKVKGTIDEAALTIWAARTKFKGDIDALVTSETKDIKESGGKVELTGPVLVWIAGRSEPARARRLLGHFDDRLDYRVLVVRAPNAFVFHCQTPATADAWTNVGVECMSRGTTFHVVPPAR